MVNEVVDMNDTVRAPSLMSETSINNGHSSEIVTRDVAGDWLESGSVGSNYRKTDEGKFVCVECGPNVGAKRKFYAHLILYKMDIGLEMLREFSSFLES